MSTWDRIGRIVLTIVGKEAGSSESEHAEANNRVDLDVLFENYLLWTEAGDTGDVTEEALLAPCSLVSAIEFGV